MTIRSNPDFLLYYVGVLVREARARRGTAFCSTLVGWARRALPLPRRAVPEAHRLVLVNTSAQEHRRQNDDRPGFAPPMAGR